MSQPVTFALLGPGVVAEFHQQAIAASEAHGARLGAVVHYAPERFEEIEAAFGVPCISEDELWARGDIDAVTLCTPSGQHADQAIRAAEAGKHVLVEKPIATTLGDADRMIAACEAAGVRLGVVLQRRAEPLFQKVKRALDAGDLGRLAVGVLTLPYVRRQDYYDSGGWRGTWALDGGGVLMNQGIHIIDLLVWYLGDIVEARAIGGTRFRDIEVEDVMAAALEMSSGAVATVTATTAAAPGFPHRLELYGTGGAIQIEGEAAGRWTLDDPSAATVDPETTAGAAGAGSGGDPRGIALTGHIGILRDFVDAVREEREPLITGAEGRRSLAAILKIYEAAGLQRPAGGPNAR